ncbi:MAG: DEAD/DEAH box helicase, partial [Oscillospiraceae bacterium]
MKFEELNLSPNILRAVKSEGYEIPSEIQEASIPPLLAGRDLVGCAQTGTGKTAAFALPIIQLLEKRGITPQRNIRSLILTPTRELAMQIFESFHKYGKYTKLKYGVVFGGVSQKPQETMLQKGIDVLVATPGRLNDLINQGLIKLGYLEIFVLDEADRMLDMGFIGDVKKVIACMPAKKQTMLFSATMPNEIKEISDKLLNDPIKIAVTPIASTLDTVSQGVYFVDKGNKQRLLTDILAEKKPASTLVFTRTKHGADKVVEKLLDSGIKAAAIHGNKSQNNRQLALSNFKCGKIKVLVATDIAARGIDVDSLALVVNFDLPNIPETYVHRIGRTGRAGLEGDSISFCDFSEKPFLADIEKLI